MSDVSADGKVKVDLIGEVTQPPSDANRLDVVW